MDGNTSTEHTAALATKDSRIVEFEAQLSALLAGSLVANDHRQVMDASEWTSLDAKRVRDIEEVGKGR